MEHKLNIEYIDPKKIATAKEFAMYIFGILDQEKWTDGYCIDLITDACHQILETQPVKIQKD